MHNHGSETDQLTGVSSDAAEVAQLQNGTEVVDMMLLSLKQELHVGDEFDV